MKLPQNPVTFMVDENLLGLLRRLRMMGIDAITSQGPDARLYALARQSGRRILTRDREFSLLYPAEEIYFVRGEDPKEQLVEVLKKFRLKAGLHPLSRCFHCNCLIQEVPKESLSGKVAAKTLALYETFYECPQCHKIFWEGSHYEKMNQDIAEILAQVED